MTDPFAAPLTELRLPVEVIGADVYGQQFFELARTERIHRHGVSIRLENKVVPDSELIVRNPETNEEAEAVVVGQIRKVDTGRVYGLAFLDPSADLWHLEFPNAEAARIVHLKCSGCQSVCALSLSDVELEIFEAQRELTRFCNTCHSSRAWRETDREVTGKLSGNPAETKRVSPAAASLMLAERRKNRRTKMKMTACVRFSGQEEVVTCEDVSKGGFRFIGRKEYPEGIRVEVSVPFTKSSNNIFSHACISFCLKIQNEQFRHGVTYIKYCGPTGWNPYDP